ncbi:MAG: hypothetical protein KAS49_04530 [Candidatus Cloacimonetes bacterium]|nr:hypothetical protein [Candidatus Cloacimonadota bacterium]
MKNQLSYSQIGNELIHELRNTINNSEGQIDVANYFSYVTFKLLKSVFNSGTVNITDSSILFEPSNDEHYKIDNSLLDNEEFVKIWECSDLSNVISKFAKTAHHRYVHHTKHQEKTNKKIRN